MKLPMVIAAMLGITASILMIMFAATVPRQQEMPAISAQPECQSQTVVMGQDFAALLKSPEVKLDIVQGPGRISFEWSTRNEARRHDVEELGQHMYDVKRLLEITSPTSDWQTSQKSTAMR